MRAIRSEQQRLASLPPGLFNDPLARHGGFGRSSQWPFDELKYLGNAQYRRAVRYAITSGRAARNWVVAARRLIRELDRQLPNRQRMHPARHRYVTGQWAYRGRSRY